MPNPPSWISKYRAGLFFILATIVLGSWLRSPHVPQLTLPQDSSAWSSARIVSVASTGTSMILQDAGSSPAAHGGSYHFAEEP